MTILAIILTFSAVMNVVLLCYNHWISEAKDEFYAAWRRASSDADDAKREFIDYLKQRDLASPHPGEVEGKE